MLRDFLLPDLGEGLTESEIVSWHVVEGESVTRDQAIAEVETAKAVVELPAPFTGVIERLHVEAGTVVDVGTTIVSFRTDEDEDGGGAAPTSASEGLASADRERGEESEDEEAAPPNLVGYGATATTRGAPTRRARRFAEQSPAGVEASGGSAGQSEQSQPVHPSSAQPAEPAPPGQSERTPPPQGLRTAPPVRSTPPVRALAQRLGVVIDDLEGSGEDGRVTRDDVEAAGRASEQAASAPPVEGARSGGGSGADSDGSADSPDSTGSPGSTDDERVPVRGVQKHMARAMTDAAATPQVTVFLTVDVTATTALLEQLRGRREHAEGRLTFLAAVARALCLAVRRHREVNARWDGDAIVRPSRVDLGIAAATPRGLVVPFLADVGDASLVELATGISELATTARAGKTAPSALEGGTITLSNVGVFGVDAGTPILHRGQAAILAVGAVRRRPWEHEGEVALRDVVTLSLSIDHRVLDGEQGARFLAAVGDTLRDPVTAFVG